MKDVPLWPLGIGALISLCTGNPIWFLAAAGFLQVVNDLRINQYYATYYS